MQVIDGFKGGAEVRLAVENGEVDGYCGSWQSVKLTWNQAVTSGVIRLVLQMTLNSHPEIKHVPLAMSYAKRMKGAGFCEWSVSIETPISILCLRHPERSPANSPKGLHE